ncbi:MAG TPA: tyrosine-type recombinase/integrase [Pseudonocardiaceae bacterium]|nr:tyrosine-type recombinase/integrase [Pseudonocardiaceae bacterium]
MASTEKLPSGKYRPIARDANGKKIPGLGTFDRKRDAQHAANEAEVEARRQAARTTGALPATITWGEWWDTLVVDRAFDSARMDAEQSVVKNHLRPQWGDEPLNKINQKNVQKWVNGYANKRTARGTPYKPASIHTYYGVFTASINAAVREGILGASPLVGIRLPVIPDRIAKPYVSTDYFAKLKSKLRGDYAAIIEFGLETGLRPGEIAGLHDDQVNEELGMLLARTVYLRRRKLMRDWPKNKRERLIPLTSRALEIYRERTAGRDMSGPCGIEHVGGALCTGALVFLTERGAVLNSDALAKTMKRAAGAVKLPVRAGYALRRGFATRLREANADPFTMMELMGHKRLEETHGYAQQGDEFKQQVRTALGDPEAAKLRVVGPRGTARGTDASQQPTEDERKSNRRESG